MRFYNQIIMELIWKKEEMYVTLKSLFHNLRNDFSQQKCKISLSA